MCFMLFNYCIVLNTLCVGGGFFPLVPKFPVTSYSNYLTFIYANYFYCVHLKILYCKLSTT